MAVDTKDLSRLFSSAGLVLLGVLFASFTNLIERLLIGRLLSPGVYGHVNVGLAILGLAVTVSMIGFNSGVPRYLSRYDAGRDQRTIFTVALLSVLATGTLTTLALLAVRETLATTVFSAPVDLITPFVLAVPVIVTLRTVVAAIRGFENTRYKFIANDIFYPAVRITLVIALLSSGLGVLAVGYAYIAAGVLTIALLLVLLNRLIPLLGRVDSVTAHTRNLTTFSLPLLFSTVLSVLLTRTDTLLISYFRSSFEVGLYSAAYPLANALLAVLSSFGYVYLPMMSRLDAEHRSDEIEELYQLTTKWIFIVTFPLFAVFSLFSGDVLAALFGSDYRGAAVAFSVLTIGFFTSAAAGRNRKTITALGHTRYILVADTIAFGTNIALNLVFIPRYGFVGAAVASAIAYALQNAVIQVVLYVRCDISPVSEYTIRTFLALPIVLLPPLFLAASALTLSLVSLGVVFGVTTVGTVLLVLSVGCLQPADAVFVDIAEQRLGWTIPFVRRFIPAE